MSEMSNIDNATKSELLQAVEDEQIKINQNIVKLFGMELYVEKKDLHNIKYTNWQEPKIMFQL